MAFFYEIQNQSPYYIIFIKHHTQSWEKSVQGFEQQLRTYMIIYRLLVSVFYYSFYVAC